MCGILGNISTEHVDEEAFKSKLKTLSHRGPDDFGTFIEGNIALGQTRLSIIDLTSCGHQPMSSKCNNFVIVYNGEIYNFEKIKEDLQARGYEFESETDTEVILYGYIEFGHRIVEMLNGMFAFSIYDRRKNRIFIARDRSGIKPLYYKKNDIELSFASEIKAIKSNEEKINEDAKILYLLLGYIPEPITIYEEILAFPAGHYGYIADSELRTYPFKGYEFQPKIEKPYKEVVKDLAEIFESVIGRQLISDAPIGTFLSGGLDSSAITAIAAKFKPDLQTLSLVFEEPDFSEEHYQDLIVDMYQTNHTKHLVNEQVFLSTLDEYLKAIEQPTIDGLNTLLVSKAARASGLTTVLSGLGGDEIFYGYPSFKDGKTLKFLSNVPYSIIKIFEYSKKFNKLELIQAEKELAYYLPRRALFTPTEISELLGVDKHKIFSVIAKLWKSYNTENIEEVEDKISFFELNLYMKNQLLRDSDLFGMSQSLEIRVPFLDNELVDYTLRVKPAEKFGEFNKQLLADVVRKVLPSGIVDRDKMGFVLPFEKWFRKNIEYYEVNETIKRKFIHNEISWTKFWAIFILQRFESR